MESVPKDPDKANTVQAKSKRMIPAISLDATLKLIRISITSNRPCKGKSAASNIGSILVDIPIIMMVMKPKPTT